MLKLLACASALALTAPAAAQIGTDIAGSVTGAAQLPTTQLPDTALGASGAVGTDTTLGTPPVDSTLDSTAGVGVETGDANVAADAGIGADATVAASPDTAVDAAAQTAGTVTDTTAGVAGDTADVAAGASAQVNDSAQAATYVRQQFSAHDGDGDGALTVDEFGAWLGPIQARQDASTDIEAWTTAAFAQADADGNAKVSMSEMTAFLAG